MNERMRDKNAIRWWRGLLVVLMAASVGASQRPSETASAGYPDLQGVWNFSNITPLQRPPEVAGKEVVTGAEAVAFQKWLREEQAKRETSDFYKVSYDHDTWYENAMHGPKRNVVLSQLQTSLIIDPPDGRLQLTIEGKKRIAESTEAYTRKDADGPEQRTLSDRCLVGFNAGPPLMPSQYNNNLQIVQTRDHVVVVTEMVHTARIIPLDGQPHVPPSIRLWAGDSRGRWQGDALVVETTNFNDQPLHSPGISSTSKKRVVERFVRRDSDTLRYEVTVEDPVIYSRPWTARFDMQRGTAVYEYACHEGNHALRNILSASRARERARRPQK